MSARRTGEAIEQLSLLYLQQLLLQGCYTYTRGCGHPQQFAFGSGDPKELFLDCYTFPNHRYTYTWAGGPTIVDTSEDARAMNGNLHKPKPFPRFLLP